MVSYLSPLVSALKLRSHGEPNISFGHGDQAYLEAEEEGSRRSWDQSTTNSHHGRSTTTCEEVTQRVVQTGCWWLWDRRMGDGWGEHVQAKDVPNQHCANASIQRRIDGGPQRTPQIVSGYFVMFKQNGVSAGYIKLSLFGFSLNDGDKEWLDSLDRLKVKT